MSAEDDHEHRNGLLLGRPLGLREASLSSGQIRRRRDYTLRDFNRNALFSELHSYRGNDDLFYSDEGHLLTVAPTGSGKGLAAIIPNLLTYHGPIVVTDPKGENYAVTSRARRELGQSVYKLDPFRVVDDSGDCLNPLDIFTLPNSERETDAQMLAELLSLGNVGAGFDRFWHNSAYGLLSGVIAYVASLDDEGLRPSTPTAGGVDTRGQTKTRTSTPRGITTNKNGSHRTFSNLMKTLHSDDVIYNLSSVLETVGSKLPPLAYSEISSFLQKSDKERSGVLSTANSYLKAFNSERTLRTLDASSFLLNDIMLGRPISIYLIIPPDKLNSHKALLRIWIGAIMYAITSRKVIPENRTLFVIDECAQLGTFPFLESAITLCRGYGLQTWTFWQDLAQLKKLYEIGWPTMINNCGILQFFGANNFQVAKDLSDLIGIDEEDVRRLSKNEQIVVINGQANKCTKHNYRTDAEFSGKYDANPYYVHKQKKRSR
jgi:type IV secretion system protein VirD4